MGFETIKVKLETKQIRDTAAARPGAGLAGPGAHLKTRARSPAAQHTLDQAHLSQVSTGRGGHSCLALDWDGQGQILQHFTLLHRDPHVTGKHVCPLGRATIQVDADTRAHTGLGLGGVLRRWKALKHSVYNVLQGPNIFAFPSLSRNSVYSQQGKPPVSRSSPS